PQRGGDRRARLRRARSRRPERGGGPRRHARDRRRGRAAAPGRTAALLHGDRGPARHPRRRRARDRHVRLRSADAPRAHRLGADLGRPAQPPKRALCTRLRVARRGLRLPRVHALLARVHPPSRDAAGDARAPAAHAAQPPLPAPADCGRPRGDRGRTAGRLQRRSRASARPGALVSIVALLILIALLILFWFVWVMPQRRRQRRHVEDLLRLIELLQPGDEIITAGGLHGTVRSVADEELQVEIAPGVEVTLDRRAVAAVTSIDEAASEPEDAVAR